jgi:hypothetical protein
MGGKGSDRTVYRTSEGLWANKRNDSDRASGLHEKQSDAVKEAKELLQNQGGGELTIVGRDRVIRSKDTISPGNDPNPPRDREH